MGQGPIGPEGDRGPDGDEGPEGEIGDRGPQGPKGKDSGIQGKIGPAGPTGPLGLNGQRGHTGPDGDTGSVNEADLLMLTNCEEVVNAFTVNPDGSVRTSNPIKFTKALTITDLNGTDAAYKGPVSYNNQVNYEGVVGNTTTINNAKFNKTTFAGRANFNGDTTYEKDVVFNGNTVFASGKTVKFNKNNLKLSGNINTNRVNIQGTMKIPNADTLTIMTTEGRFDNGNIVFRSKDRNYIMHGHIKSLMPGGSSSNYIPAWY